MKVIGIDPAPAKETVIYDGEKFMTKDAVALKNYLEDIKKSEDNVLICWDAPLTGMASVKAIEKFKEYLNNLEKKKTPKWSPLEARIIEKYIALQDIPKGISTNSFSQCPHWTITQYCLGLPQIFQPEKIYPSNVPFNLITEQKLPSEDKNVVEVHPALALWLWLKENNPIKDNDKWNYKKNETTFKTLTELLFKKAELLLGKQQAFDISKIEVTVIKSKEETVEAKTMTDDHFDAYIAWLLGALWLKNEVILVGNKNTGAMLLPKEVSEDWQAELDKYK